MFDELRRLVSESYRIHTTKDCGVIYDVKQSANDIIADRHCRSTAWELSARCLQSPMMLVSAVAAVVAAAAAVVADNDDVAAERAASQSHHRHMSHDVKPPVVHCRHHKGLKADFVLDLGFDCTMVVEWA
jgi:hypothetical protein